ncbi:MAG: alpha/beta fold hydrolase [Candidatus Latescibacterota bacterium]
MSERMIIANGVELCAESFGNPAGPPILLISGASESMLWWDEGFCRMLSENGRFVVRYDNRDTGRSITYETGKPRYALDDMVEDVVGVLDAYGISLAHLVGLSLGGIIAQLVAIRHPERALTITLMSSTPHGPEDPDLPPMDEKFLAYFNSASNLDWSDEAAVIDFMVVGRRLLSGSGHSFDEARTREIAAQEFRRARNVTASMNHALIASERWRERLGEISAPTLVIHGTEDPVLPYGHGVALSREIPGAKLLTLEGAGHEVHRADWDIIINAILRHTSK